jgi:hypothetical protein
MNTMKATKEVARVHDMPPPSFCNREGFLVEGPKGAEIDPLDFEGYWVQICRWYPDGDERTTWLHRCFRRRCDASRWVRGHYPGYEIQHWSSF